MGVVKLDVDELNNALTQVSDNSIEVGKSEELFEVTQECLGFRLNNEFFAVPILRVEEIRGWESPSSLPDSNAFVKGVINLRGAVVPIVDLREKFLGSEQAYESSTVVIVLRVFYPNEDDKIAGVVVDSVTDVIQYNPKNLKQMPEMDDHMAEGFVDGLIDFDDEVYFMLDIDKLLNINEF